MTATTHTDHEQALRAALVAYETSKIEVHRFGQRKVETAGNLARVRSVQLDTARQIVARQIENRPPDAPKVLAADREAFVQHELAALLTWEQTIHDGVLQALSTADLDLSIARERLRVEHAIFAARTGARAPEIGY